MKAPDDTSRLPPHSLEAEMGALGCVLQDPAQWLPEAEARLPQLEVFYDLRNRLIFEHLLKMFRAGRPVDEATLTERLIVGDAFEKAGGAAHIAALLAAAPSPSNFEYWADIVIEKFTQRRMVQTCVAAVDRIYAANGDGEQVLDEIERDVLRVAEQRVADDRTHHISGPAAHVAELIDNYRRGIGMIDGVRTGYGYLDKILGGLHAGEMTVLAGRPGTGKTSLAMNIAENIAFGSQLPVGVLSMEMNEVDLTLRVMCARNKVQFHEVRTGFASLEDMEKLKRAATGEMARVPIYIDDTPSLEVLQLRAKARRMVKRFGVRVLFIDYLQLAHSRNAQKQVERITHVSEAIKALARELNIPVVALSQLSREFEKEGNRKPRLSDLRDSGAVEQDADAVWMLYRRRVLDEEGAPLDFNDVKRKHLPLPVNILIAKQRNGPSDTDVEMLFLRQFMRFEDGYGNRGRKQEEDP